MPDINVINSNGNEINLNKSKIDGFKSKLLGSLLIKGDPDYDNVRALWNGMIDRKPALIARCSGTSDVIASVNFARENNLLVSVRGAGHNIAGTASSDGGMMIDLSQMKGIRVDPEAKVAFANPGATLHNLDHETQAFGLAVPTGINSTTGISGLTLGGGFGWLSRSLGLTADNLIAADVVTADGKLVHASSNGTSDLLWGLRGGGGNFGIVTSFRYRLHQVGPQLLCGLIVHPFNDAKKVFKYYLDFIDKTPEQLTCWVVLRKAPPLPFLPADVHGKEIFIMAFVYNGDIKEGEKILEPLRKFGNPIAENLGPVPYEAFQQAFDPLLTPGARNYWKSHNFYKISDEVLDIIIKYASQLPTPMSEIFVGNLGGAVNRVKKDATAYPHRDIKFFMNVHTRWEDKNLDDKCIEWARKFSDETGKFATGGVYVNFISEGENRVNSAFGSNYEKLARLKKKYDPDNFFKINQNIKPF
jgi:FAD/FMN-containing dehydrogenase